MIKQGIALDPHAELALFSPVNVEAGWSTN